MNNVKVYRCFIASPADTSEERKICDEVFNDINKTAGQEFNFRLESVKWKDASPDFSTEPQAVINEQLFQGIDIFIGIMYQCFGSPTKHYGSGTEEEFYKAHALYESDPNSIKIKMYFNDAPTEPSKLNLPEYQKVREFRALISELGGLYSTYNGVEDFKQKIRTHIEKDILKLSAKKSSSTPHAIIKQALLQKREDALVSYEKQPVIWVDRILCKAKDVGERYEDGGKIEISTLVDKPYSLFIEAQPQFGLTCLAHHFVLEAWENGFVWIYLDAEKMNRSQSDIQRAVKKECELLGKGLEDVNCIILDSWKKSGEGMKKLLRNLCETFQETPIFVMSTTDASISSDQETKIDRSFEYLKMLPLTKNGIRQIVTEYNSDKQIEKNDDTVLNKIIQDLDVLNIHRTPMHCLTLLKVAEKKFDEQPVNRSKMIDMVLTVLFDFGKYPDYSSKPDVDHCQFLLGFFCEFLIRHNEGERFSRELFEEKTSDFVKNNKINLNVYVVFETLFNNHIIIKDGSKLKFKHVFWIYYFAAKRMEHSKDFYNFILNNKKYIHHIEIIDFYTGGNRGENDLIQLLIDDLSDQCNLVEEKTGLDVDINPLSHLKSAASDEKLIKTHESIKKQVLGSKLPDLVKDEYADRDYNLEKPNSQNLHEIYEEYSFIALQQKIRLCSIVLRNSDFIDPDKKTKLFNEITRGWSLFSKILFALSPLLVKSHNVFAYGITVILAPEFQQEKDPKEKLISIIDHNIMNVLYYLQVQEDLHSDRISPVLEEKFVSEDNALIKHQMATFLIMNKPHKWDALIEGYINSIKDRKSYYLNDVYHHMIHSYKYDFANNEQIHALKDLIEICHVKMITDSKHLRDTARSIKNKRLREGATKSLMLPNRVFKDE